MVDHAGIACPSCQTANAIDAVFCDECGAPLDAHCQHCGESNRRGAKFCNKCGSRLSATVELDKSNTPIVSGEIAGRSSVSPEILAEERKRVTVLFADIRGSTAFIEKLDPEEVRRQLDPVLRVMMDAVHRYGGTVNQLLGDGIMALFGAPMAHEDHAVRACDAALAMQEEMRREGEKSGEGEGRLRIGIGMNSGEVVVRSVANDLTFDYSALGRTTHLAARMEELAPPGAILITSASAREVEGFVQLKALGGWQVKGVSQPVEAFELVGATSARTRLQAAARRGLTPFVGRDAETENFRRLIEKVAVDGGQILAMVGEAGMGKSRLVCEFTENHLPAGWRIVAGTSVSYGKATPYFPINEMLRRYFAIAEGDSVEIVRTKIVEQIAKLDPALIDTIPAILTLLGAMPAEDGKRKTESLSLLDHDAEVVEVITQFHNMEPPQRRRSTLDGVKRLLLRESQT